MLQVATHARTLSAPQSRGSRSHFFRLRLRSCSKMFESVHTMYIFRQFLFCLKRKMYSWSDFAFSQTRLVESKRAQTVLLLQDAK